MNLIPLILPIVISSIIIAIIVNIDDVSDLCESDTCPFCYGDDLCENVEKISLSYETMSNWFNNIMSVKNVYFAKYGNNNVVLKKLAHNDELSRLNLTHCATDNAVNTYNHSDSYKLCDDRTVELLSQRFQHLDATHYCTILNVNIEPIVLKLFDNFPVPKFYGSCGRIVVEENAGNVDLNGVEDLDWFDRAFIGYQLLMAAKRFTFDHPTFRLYLTDITPDNIVVDEDLVVNFIDLEHVILKAKGGDPMGYSHRSVDFQDVTYGFSGDDICSSDISDHNIYSVCKLLLSKCSPWPMMSGGLLHDPPSEVADRHRDLFEGVERCVGDPNSLSNRFEVSDIILDELRDVLEGKSYLLSRF